MYIVLNANERREEKSSSNRPKLPERNGTEGARRKEKKRKGMRLDWSGENDSLGADDLVVHTPDEQQRPLIPVHSTARGYYEY